MIRIRIEDQVFKMPSVDEISLDKGCQVEKIAAFFDHTIGTKKRGLSVLMDCPVQVLNKVQDSQINFLFDNLIFFDSSIGIKSPKGFSIDEKTYSLMDFSTMSTYVFAELEYLLKDAYANAAEVLAVLYRPIQNQAKNKEKILSINRKITYLGTQSAVLPLEEDYSTRTTLFREHVNFYCAKAAILEYINFRVKLLKEYGMLDAEELPADQVDEEPMEDTSSSFPEVWGIYYLLDLVSNGSVVEQDAWLQKPANQFLKRAYYIKQKNAWQRN